jgi:uncharacterized protein (TIGR03083 family)
MEIEQWIADERRRLADVLDGLSPEQWDAPSLCEGWAVRDVVAHVTMPFRTSTPRFALELVRSGGRFAAMADRVARRDGARPTAVLVAELRDNAEHPWTPPGGGKEGALTHDLVHGLDITRPLGMEREVQPARFRVVLDTLMDRRSRRHFGTDGHTGRFEASDIGWSHGTGAPVSGRAVDLVLLLTGRSVPAGAIVGTESR